MKSHLRSTCLIDKSSLNVFLNLLLNVLKFSIQARMLHYIALVYACYKSITIVFLKSLKMWSLQGRGQWSAAGISGCWSRPAMLVHSLLVMIYDISGPLNYLKTVALAFCRLFCFWMFSAVTVLLWFMFLVLLVWTFFFTLPHAFLGTFLYFFCFFVFHLVDPLANFGFPFPCVLFFLSINLVLCWFKKRPSVV